MSGQRAVQAVQGSELSGQRFILGRPLISTAFCAKLWVSAAEALMHVGRVVFVQLMEHLPWKSFGRTVSRYGGDPRVRGVSCANQFRCMALAQLTYRESLRDIEACLRAQQAKLYRLGIRGAVAGSTLAEANESRAIVKQRLEPSATLYETLQILRPTMFETTRLNQLLDFAAPATPRSHFQQPIESVRELTGQ